MSRWKRPDDSAESISCGFSICDTPGDLPSRQNGIPTGAVEVRKCHE